MARYTVFEDTDTLNIGDEVFNCYGYSAVTDYKNNKYYHLSRGGVITRENLISRSAFLKSCIGDLKSQGVEGVTAEDLVMLSDQASVITPFCSLFVVEDALAKFKALLPYLLSMKYERFFEVDSHVVYKTSLDNKRFFVVAKKGEPLVHPQLYKKLYEALEDFNL